MKLFPNLLQGTAAILYRVFKEGAYADKALERTFRLEKRWGARDRAFVAENVYECVRNYRFLSYTLGLEPEYPEQFVWLIGLRLQWSGVALPEWQEFAYLRREKENIAARQSEALGIRKLRESVPDWLDELGEAQLGEEWDLTLAALNRPAPLVIRVNTLKTTREELIGKLQAAGVPAEPVGESGLVLTNRSNLFALDTFKAGHFEVQDYSSQLVAPALDLQPGMRVIDACSGAGGKALHMAAIMRNKGRIVAMDTEGWKLQELRKRSSRAGVDIIETRPIEGLKTVKRLAGSADRLLLDVPCTGLGVLRRNPDAKWKLSPETLARVIGMQKDILFNYSAMLRVGGLMVYATCSILPAENEQQVSAFLQAHEGRFRLIEQQSIWPQDGFDGFYIARIQRES